MRNRVGIVFLIFIACYAAIIFKAKDRTPTVIPLTKATTAPAVFISTDVRSDPVPEMHITQSFNPKASTTLMSTTFSSIAMPTHTITQGRIIVFHIPPALRDKFLMLAIELCHRKVKRGKSSDFFACSTDLETKISLTLDEYVFDANYTAKSKLAQAIKGLIENGIVIPANIFIEHLENAKENQTRLLTITMAPNFVTTTTTTTRSWTSLPFSGRSRSSGFTKPAINCWLYTGTPAISGNDKSPSNMKGLPNRKRSTGAHKLQRRSQKQISQIGKCPQLLNPALKKRPPYMGLKQVMNEHGGLPQAQWWFIPHQITSHGGACDVADLQHVGRRDANNGNPGKNNWPIGYSGPGAIKRLSVDHDC